MFVCWWPVVVSWYVVVICGCLLVVHGGLLVAYDHLSSFVVVCGGLWLLPVLGTTQETIS